VPGRCCSSRLDDVLTAALPLTVRSGPGRGGSLPTPPAHPRSPSPRRVRRPLRQPHIPAVLPRDQAGRSHRHASRTGVAAGLSRVAPHATGGPPRHAPPVALVGLRRARTIHVDHVPDLCPQILAIPRRSGSEITEISRRPCRSSSGCRGSSRRDVVRQPRTDRTHPLPSGVPSGSSTAAGRSHQLVTDAEDPASPASRAVHKFAHCGGIFCGYRLQAPPRLPRHGHERHSYTACGWSCPQSSTGLLWVFTSAECRRRRSTTGPRMARQILTTSWFSPRNLWTEDLVHTLWTAYPDRVCAQFCGQLWTKALSVWTGHPRSVDDVWGQIGRPQALRLSHTEHTGSSTRICAL